MPFEVFQDLGAFLKIQLHLPGNLRPLLCNTFFTADARVLLNNADF